MIEKEKTIKPDYYRNDSIDVIDTVKIFKLNFNLGNVFKYIVRAGVKNPEKHIEDLLKAREYLDREIEYFSREKNQ